MARADPASVQFQAANGRILSPERSKEMHRASSAAASSDVLARHLALEQAIADEPLVARQPRRHARERARHLRRDVRRHRGARDSINMETYILEDDEVGQQLRRRAASPSRRRASRSI